MPRDLQADTIERICERITVLASNCMDAGRLEEFALYHTDDTEFIRPSTYPGAPLVGIQQILSVLKARNPMMVSRHLLTNVSAHALSDNEASGTACFAHFAGTRTTGSDAPIPMTSALVSMGEYQMRFRCVAGAWRIHRRVGRFIFGGVYQR